jgi:hypothetical protein
MCLRLTTRAGRWRLAIRRQPLNQGLRRTIADDEGARTGSPDRLSALRALRLQLKIQAPFLLRLLRPSGHRTSPCAVTRSPVGRNRAATLPPAEQRCSAARVADALLMIITVLRGDLRFDQRQLALRRFQCDRYAAARETQSVSACCDPDAARPAAPHRDRSRLLESTCRSLPIEISHYAHHGIVTLRRMPRPSREPHGHREALIAIPRQPHPNLQLVEASSDIAAARRQTSRTRAHPQRAGAARATIRSCSPASSMNAGGPPSPTNDDPLTPATAPR